MSQYRDPIPVQSFQPGYGGYGAYPVVRTRPGLLTTLGILSILIALLTLAGSFFTAVWATAMYAMSQASAMIATLPPTTPTPSERTYDVEPDPIVGFEKSQRLEAMRVMTELRPMTTIRRKQLDALLAQAGKTMFPGVTGTNPAIAVVRKSIGESGVLPSPRTSATGPHYFVLGTGRIEVYDDHAIFRPTGSGDVVNVSVEASPAPTPAPAPVRPPKPIRLRSTGPKIDPSIVWMMAAECLASAALAVYLFIAGILVLRDSRRGRTLHWIYIILKIPLALLGAYAMWRFCSTISGTINLPPSAIALALLGAALLYPLILALVLLTPSVRDYYRTDIV